MGRSEKLFPKAFPAGAGRFWSFTYPHQVAADARLLVDEKRAILSAWASDVHAVESLPALRHLPGTPFPVTFSSIMDALARLDRESSQDFGPSLRPDRDGFGESKAQPL